MVKKMIKNIYLGLILIFLYSPIIVLMVFSFNNSKSTSVWSGFTIQWYIELFKDRMIMKSLYYTLTIAITSTIISTLVGVISAFGIFYMGSFKKKIMLNINNLPVLNPDIVTGVAMMSLFVFLKNLTGLRFGFITLLIAHITFSIPFVILSILPKLKQMPKDIWDAAIDLGAKPTVAFIKVILPEIKPGIITGALIAFTMSIDDFVISYFTTGSGVTNLSITIFSMARRGINPKINALSTLMFITIMLLIIFINKRQKRESLKIMEVEK
ncbi:MAG TPA: ABC transporter permease [Clostridia bacterium]|nr:ABC transporter permease [Clostridia bacterium]